MDDPQSTPFLNSPFILFLVLTTALVLSGLLYKRKRQNSHSVSDQVEWKIDILSSSRDKNQTKLGTSLKQLQKQKKENICFLEVKQNHLNIMKGIFNWNLTNLNALYLNSNKIQSIEMLSWINLPNLQALDLSNNLITQLRSMRKMQLQKLFLLSLHHNPICIRIDLCQFNIVELQYVWLQFFQSQRPFHDDIRCFAKSQCQYLRKFHIKSSIRIEDKSFFEVLHQKYTNLDKRVKNK